MNIAILLMIGSQIVFQHNADRNDFYPASTAKQFVAEFYFSKGHRGHDRDIKRLITVSANRPYSPLVRHVGVDQINERLSKIGLRRSKITHCLCTGNKTTLRELNTHLRVSIGYPRLKKWLRTAMWRRERLVKKFFPKASVYGKSGSVGGMWMIENFIIERPGKPLISVGAILKWSFAGCKKRDYRCMRNHMDGYLMSLLLSVRQKVSQ